jgi:phosphinothricin acetyltransferase
VIALPNAASVALHTAFSYEQVGGIHAAGFKHGGWHDVSIWQNSFVLGDEPPSPVVPLDQL